MRRAVLAIACVWSISEPANAQSSLQVPIQFDFLNPSARSLALGGAFVGLADDATAALVNPAGLVDLTRAEISIEGRFRRFEQPFVVGGRLSGPITNNGQDRIAGPDLDTIADSGFGINFVSFVYPRGRLRFAAFRQQLIDVEQDFSSRGVFQNRGFDARDTAFTALRTLNVDTYGASAGLNAGRAWLGAGLLVQRFSLGFDFERFLHEDFYGAPDPTQSLFQFTQTGNDTAVGAVFGVMVPLCKSDPTNPSRSCQQPVAKVGVSYKRAPRFDFESFSGGLVGSQQRTTAQFKVPDVFAAGVSATLNDAFLVTAEYTRVFHAQLRSEYVEVLARQGESRDRIDRFTVDSAHEVHVGAEYILPVAARVRRVIGRPAIRGGAWFDPDHSVHYAPTAANDLLDERIAASLSSGRDQWHVTFGTMIAVRRLFVSAAVDRSARSTVVSTSAIIRF